MEIIKKHYAKCLYVVFIAMLVISSFKYFNEQGKFQKKGVILVSVGLLVLLIITNLILIKLNKSSIANQFLLIALIWGVAFVFINPQYLVPDESVHIFRSYDLAKGRIFYRGNENSCILPASIGEHDMKVWNSYGERSVKSYIKAINTPIEKNTVSEYNATATAAYTSIAYIPQSIGMFIGDSLNLPPYFIITLGRLTNLLVWIILCYFAIKFISIKKELLFMLVFIPMGMQQAASCSPDALLNSTSFLLIAYVLYLKFEKERVIWKDSLILIVLAMIISSIKLPYVAISGVLILIPNKKIKCGVWGKIGLILSVIVVSLGLMVTWNKVSKPINNAKAVVENAEKVEKTQNDSSETGYVGIVKKVLNEPKEFVDTVINTLKVNSDFYLASFTAYFGWFKVLASRNFRWMIIWGILLFALKGDENGYKLKMFDKGILLLISLGMYVILCLVSLQWKKVPISELDTLGGIQGRYFYPFVIGIPLLLQNTKLNLKINKYWINSYRNAYVSWTLAFSLAMIYIGYFS